jgi:hypothetical protein
MYPNPTIYGAAKYQKTETRKQLTELLRASKTKSPIIVPEVREIPATVNRPKEDGIEIAPRTAAQDANIYSINSITSCIIGSLAPFPDIARQIHDIEKAVALTLILCHRSRFAATFSINIMIAAAAIPVIAPGINAPVIALRGTLPLLLGR